MRRFFAFLICLFATTATWADGPIIIRMMAGGAYGIPPKEATTTQAVVRRTVFETVERQNPGIRVVNAGGLESVGDQADNMFLMSMAGLRPRMCSTLTFASTTRFWSKGSGGRWMT